MTAEVSILRPGLTPMTAGGRKIVLHTTEGGDQARFVARDLAYIDSIHNSYLRQWAAGGYPTQYLVSVQCRRVTQCVPLDRGGYALVDLSGGVAPNRAGDRVIQVELVGHAAMLEEEYDTDDWVWLGEWLREVCAAEGVPYEFPCPFMPYPGSYGQTGARLSGPAYLVVEGIIGHQHVPENSHGDPGVIRVDLMAAPVPVPSLPEEDDMARLVEIGVNVVEVGPGGVRPVSPEEVFGPGAPLAAAYAARWVAPAGSLGFVTLDAARRRYNDTIAPYLEG